MEATGATTLRQRTRQPLADPESAKAQAPIVLDRYTLRKRLGAGAFGTVWQAHDDRLDREVAVKIVQREKVVGGRFQREARAAARLAHPGIVTLYEAGADDHGAYLVSELVRGVTLDDLLTAGRLSDRDVVEIGIALCEALAHAHAQGVVHRDVKPSNVLIPDRPASAAQIAKLTDFGVARVIGGDTLTRTGDVIGTAAYMAPEQAEGLEAGAPADLYALALVLYEALTGINPVRAGTAARRARRLGAHLPPLRRQRRELPRELARAIDLALRPRPRERGTIDEFRAALIASLAAVGNEPGVVAAPFRAERRPPKLVFEEPEPAPEPPVSDESALEVMTAAPAWPERALAAAAGAGLAAWLTAHVLASTPAAPAAAALITAALLLVLPRIGWIAALALFVTAALAQDRAGAAIVVGLAALVPVLLVPLAGTAWPLASGAPALGALGLAGAWPALAARAHGIVRRAVLGATGWVWLLLASPLADKGLYVHELPGTPLASVWAASPYETVHHVLGPVLSTGVLAPAALWALAAAALPYLVSGRMLVLDIVRVVIWAAVLVSGTGAVLVSVHAPHSLRTPPTAVAGAVVAAIIALAPSAVAALHRGGHLQRVVP
jgi:hypothetical protein